MHFLYSWDEVDLFKNIFEADFLGVDVLLEDISSMYYSDDIVLISLIYWITRISLCIDELHDKLGR